MKLYTLIFKYLAEKSLKINFRSVQDIFEGNFGKNML